MTPIIPILLCDGPGTPLRPLSRKSDPKKYRPLIGERNLFQASAKPGAGQGNGVDFSAPVVLIRIRTGSSWKGCAQNRRTSAALGTDTTQRKTGCQL